MESTVTLEPLSFNRCRKEKGEWYYTEANTPIVSIFPKILVLNFVDLFQYARYPELNQDQFIDIPKEK